MIDLLVKSSYCQACTYSRHHTDDLECAQHLENCTINHKGSAGKMEVDAVLEIFRRPEENFGIIQRNCMAFGSEAFELRFENH